MKTNKMREEKTDYLFKSIDFRQNKNKNTHISQIDIDGIQIQIVLSN